MKVEVLNTKIIMSVHQNHIEEIIQNLAKKLQLKDWNYETKLFKETKENCFGDIIPVILFGLQNGTRMSFDLICKFAPEYKCPDVTKAVYAAEIFVYEKLIVAFKKLNTDIDLDELIPQCVHTIENKVLIFKDMRSQGFRLCKDTLDLQHVNIALEALAKYHGLSFILFERDSFEGNPVMNQFDENHLFMKVLHEFLEERSDIFENTKVYQNIINFKENFKSIVRESMLIPKHLVFGHGDFWAENILYKYQNQTPIKACILDFQASRLLCPAQDVLFFIATCVDSDTRKNHIDEILSVYYTTLQQTLVNNNIEASLYPEEEFRRDLVTLAPFCAIHAIFAISWWLGVDFSNRSEIFGNEKLKLNKSQASITKELIKKVSDLMDDFEQFGYI